MNCSSSHFTPPLVIQISLLSESLALYQQYCSKKTFILLIAGQHLVKSPPFLPTGTCQHYFPGWHSAISTDLGVRVILLLSKHNKCPHCLLQLGCSLDSGLSLFVLRN